MTTYVFSPDRPVELDRLRCLEGMFDAGSTARLAAIGVGPGWQVLEVGAGAGSLVRWFADRVGATGRVVATDIDTRFVEGVALPNVEVLRHDILADELPDGAYDLVHARAVVEHLPDRGEALARMARAVRPGGWMVVEDVDFGPAIVGGLAPYVRPTSMAPLYERMAGAFNAVFRSAGADPDFGTRLPDAMVEAGLRDVTADLHTTLRPVAADFVRLSVASLRGPLVATGTVTADDLDRLTAAATAPGFRCAPIIMATAYGRRPE